VNYLCGMETGKIYYRDLCLAVRKKLGYSQAELGDKAGVSLSTVKRFERDGSIGLDSFLRLLTGLGILIFVDYGR
jgi:transcriptional regulator with XRE-family HTH domain